MKKWIWLLLVAVVIVLNLSVISAESIHDTIVAIVEKNTQDVTRISKNQSDAIYVYKPNNIYTVYCMVDRIVDIQLQPGEELTYIGGPDSLRWVIDRDVSGSGPNRQYHIFVKPRLSNISTNFVIMTNKHVYHLELFSGDKFTPIINWSYPAEERAVLNQKREVMLQQKNNTITFNQSKSLSELNFNYRLSWRNYAWKPTMVFDDGSRTYFKLPKKFNDIEMLGVFVKSDNGIMLVNHYVKNGYLVVDCIGDCFELRVGKKAVKVVREDS